MNTTAKKSSRRLGRGLSALFEEADRAYGNVPATPMPAPGQARLPIDKLSPGPFQPRTDFDAEGLEELAASIKSRGLIQAIVVRADPANAGHYHIIAGERRWRASQMAQLHEVPVVIRDYGDEEAMEVALVENLQRRDLNPLEEAEGYRRLMDEFSTSQEDMAKAVGKSRSHVANMLRILNLPKSVQSKISEGKISFGHARALMALPVAAADVAEDIVRKGLNVRQTEQIMSKLKNGANKTGKVLKSKIRKQAKDADTLALEKTLTSRLGLRTQIDHKSGTEKGTLKIEYQSLDQLDELMQKLMG